MSPWGRIPTGSPRARTLLRYAAIAGLLTLAAGTLLVNPVAECDADPSARSRVADAVPAAAQPRRTGALPAGSDSLTLPEGTIGVPVQLAAPGTVAALRPGDRVDVVVRSGTPTAPQPDLAMAQNAVVLSVPAPADGVLYLAMVPPQARRVARLPPDVAIGVLVRPD